MSSVAASFQRQRSVISLIRPLVWLAISSSVFPYPFFPYAWFQYRPCIRRADNVEHTSYFLIKGVMNIRLEVLIEKTELLSYDIRVMPCSPVDVYWRFGGTYNFRLQYQRRSQTTARSKQGDTRVDEGSLRRWRWKQNRSFETSVNICRTARCNFPIVIL
jgi:hypothetical protein